MMKAEKQLLRQDFRLQRSRISPEERTVMDKNLFQNLIHDSWIQDADLLLAFASCQGEPDTWKLIHWAFEQGKPVALPKCINGHQMLFFVISQLEDLQAGTHDIPEPITTQQAVITDKTVCIVPGIAFTREGIRLGQGGGYYDRFLKNFPEMRTIGICYECMIQPTLPCEAHDRIVSKVITDSNGGTE